ncbi:signal recognition particle receptor subunit alpha-like isoform X2 [Lineus longissimus]|uniref:signal recognition particle receptor subunit alpha-like isoform X2 n=1 Tax=Lineus longissimus TaxID=88925 RepID=UPI002B4C8706
MLDLFTIFSKGGIVLWCFQGTSQLFTPSVNALIKSVILQERGGNNAFTHEALTLKYKLDNEFELVFVVAYQKILQLSYVDKFLNDIQMEFRNKYKDDLSQGKISRNFDDFTDLFVKMLKEAESMDRKVAKKPRQMRTFEDSQKSQKTVASMIENKKDDGKGKGKENKKNRPAAPPSKPKEEQPLKAVNGDLEDDIAKRREEFFKKKMKKTGDKSKAKKVDDAPVEVPKKKGKELRKWDKAGTAKEGKALDFSQPGEENGAAENGEYIVPDEEALSLIGQMKGGLKDLDTESSSEEEEEEEEEEVTSKKGASQKKGGWFTALKSMVGSKSLTQEDVAPGLAKMKDHLISKNVAADIADKLCQSVSTKLEGKVLGTFSGINSTVKQTVQESCVQILSPKRRIDILRDAMEAKQQKRPFSIVFCGVNGVGKSTNLAKIAFWLVENNFRVLIAACDTFRAGAVEQLRTHTRKLNALHPAQAHNGMNMVQLYEKGYGKDAAGIAMEAVNFARDCKLDVVLVDTAGRMQDNEPLMRALAKLIKVNQPDLVLFVGEALVGNEAVDQLMKFNQALADHSNMTNPRLIDGIVLTKFDTIDDKVGAAISMTYTTGQPIVFVGTGQTYTDLKNLNTKAVVHALLK